jgi:hypothetical protein
MIATLVMRRVSLSNQVSLPALTMQPVMLPKWLICSQQPETWGCQMGEMRMVRGCILMKESSLMGEYTQKGEHSQLHSLNLEWQHVSSLHGALANRTPSQGTYR